MDPQFWQDTWKSGRIGFHQTEFNPLLVEHWSALGIQQSAPVLVPLCGKSLDMHWLRERGHPIKGVELSETAIREFFREAELTPSIQERGALTVYEAAGFELCCGNLFDLSSEDLRDVRAVYDRAALVALPSELRREYTRTLAERLPERIEMLLITFEYEQERAPGPPFAVLQSEVHSLYEPGFSIELRDRIEAQQVPPRLMERGVSVFTEAAYTLRRG